MKRISILITLLFVLSGNSNAQYVLEPESLPPYINKKGYKLRDPMISPDGSIIVFRSSNNSGSNFLMSKRINDIWSETDDINELSNIKKGIVFPPMLIGFNGKSVFFDLFKEQDENINQSDSKNKPGVELKTYRMDLQQNGFSIPFPFSFSQGIKLTGFSNRAYFGNPHKIFFQSADRTTYESYMHGNKGTPPDKLPSILGGQKLVNPIVVGENGIIYKLSKGRPGGKVDSKTYMSIRTKGTWSYPIVLEIEGLKNAWVSSYCEATHEIYFMAGEKIYSAKLPSELTKLISNEYPAIGISRIENAVTAKEALNTNKESKSKYYALLIGIEDYQNNQANLVDLSNPISDAENLKSGLIANYSFEAENVNVLKNPSRAEIINSFEEISNVLTEKDNLLIFYAGHGIWDEKLNIGYWLSSDATTESKANWISNSTVRDYIAGLNTRHTLLISDACFSGSIFKTREVTKSIDDYGFYRLNKLASRKAMTSGTLNTVPDDSKFMKYLLKALAANEKEYFPSKQLFHEIEIAIINNTSNVPQFGTIQNTGDEGGDFIFIKREKE